MNNFMKIILIIYIFLRGDEKEKCELVASPNKKPFSQGNVHSNFEDILDEDRNSTCYAQK